MAVIKAVGSTVEIAATYGTAANITAITNAAEAVATFAAGHGLVAGDIIEITSGWARLNGRVVRAKTVATNDVTLEGVNTTSTTLYPTGSGTGSGRKVATWSQVTQLTQDLQFSGGDQAFADTSTLDNPIKTQIPTTRAAYTAQLQGYFDPSLSWLSTVRTASDAGTATAFRMVFPSGGRMLANAYWSLSEVPTIQDSTLRFGVSISYSANPITYAT